MSVRGERWLERMLRCPDLITSEKVVGVVICLTLSGHQWWQVAYREIGDRSALSRGIIRRAISGLERKGWLAVNRPIAEANFYSLIVPAGADGS